MNIQSNRRNLRLMSLTGLAVVVAACVLVAAATGKSTTTPVSVTLVTAQSSNPFFITQTCGAKAAAKKYNVQFKYVGPVAPDYSQEVPAFNAAIVAHPDAILLVPFDPNAFIPGMKQAAAAGIPVILDNSSVNGKLGTRLYETNNVQNGEILGEGLAKAIGGAGEVALFSANPTTSTSQQRDQGFRDALKKYPKIKLVATEVTHSDSSTAASDMAAILQAHPNLSGVFADDDGSGNGAAAGILAAGKKGVVKLFSYDATPQEIAGLKSGVFQGLLGQPAYNYGYVLTKFAAQVVRKQVNPASLPYTVTLIGKLITGQNVNSAAAKPYEYATSC